MNKLSISQAWDESRVVLAREFRLLAALALALIVLPQVVNSIVGVPVGMHATFLSQTVNLISVLLVFVAQIALCRLAMGPSVSVGSAIARGFVRVPSTLLVVIALMFGLGVVAALVAMALSGVGVGMLPSAGQPPPPALLAFLLLLIVICMAVFQLIFPVAAAETANPIRLLSRSWQLARGNYLRLLGFIVAAFIAALVVGAVLQLGLGSIILLVFGRPTPGSMAALCLGFVAGVAEATFTVVIAVMLARIYVQLTRHAQLQASVPNSGI